MESRPFSVSQQFYLSLYWFALNYHWGALLMIVIPAEVLRFVPEARKGAALGFVLALGALIAMVVQPVVGAISDRTTARLGRRRPYIIAGTIANALGILAMAYSPNLTVFTLSVLFVQLTNNISGGAYQGLIPDLVPEELRGTASGWMGLQTMVGTVVGATLAGPLFEAGYRLPFYWSIIAVLMVSMILTVWRVRETPLEEVKPFDWAGFAAGFWISPRKYPDFAWVFLTRALVLLGFYTFLSYLAYYLKDVIRLRDFMTGASYVNVAVMAGATASTLFAGWASDRYGRRSMVFISGILMGVTGLAFILTHSFAVVLAFGLVFGLGYGAYTSVDWALATDVLPSNASAGKDMGIWGIAATLPQVVAPGIAGGLLDRFNLAAPNLGYTVIFSLAVGYFAVGSILVWKIRRAR
ncbi:MAG: MFS transporter [Firmicutes bacterium]|nr:MFS transporter [Bacillota bacterium]